MASSTRPSRSSATTPASARSPTPRPLSSPPAEAPRQASCSSSATAPEAAPHRNWGWLMAYVATYHPQNRLGNGTRGRQERALRHPSARCESGPSTTEHLGGGRRSREGQFCSPEGHCARRLVTPSAHGGRH